MKNSQLIGLSLFTLVSVAAACSDQGSPTGIAAPEMRPRTVVIATGTKICSADGVSGWVATPQNPNWAVAPTGAVWVGKTPTSSTNYTRKAIDIYISQFEVPANATNVSVAGGVLADNQVLVAANPLSDNEANSIADRFFSTFTEDGTPSGHALPANQPDNTTYGNFQTVGGKAFAKSGAPLHGGTNNIVFVVYNDDAPDSGIGSDVNPSGLAFCYVVTYEVPQVVVGQGCSPGYWKNHNFPAGYIKTQAFNSNLPGNDFENAFPGKSLQDVLSTGGGGLTALGRATVSAYFNAVTLGANYGLTPDQVVNMFNAVYPGGNYNGLKDTFEALQDVNGRTCPNPTGK